MEPLILPPEEVPKIFTITLLTGNYDLEGSKGTVYEDFIWRASFPIEEDIYTLRQLLDNISSRYKNFLKLYIDDNDPMFLSLNEVKELFDDIYKDARDGDIIKFDVHDFRYYVHKFYPNQFVTYIPYEVIHDPEYLVIYFFSNEEYIKKHNIQTLEDVDIIYPDLNFIGFFLSIDYLERNGINVSNKLKVYLKSENKLENKNTRILDLGNGYPVYVYTKDPQDDVILQKLSFGYKI